MEKVFSAKLMGGRISEVYFSSSRKSVDEKLSEFGSNSLFVFDENTKDLVSRCGRNTIVLPSGEEYKTLESITKILDKALSLSLSRDSLFIAVGGGVICDMTAFAASIYMRGARTLLVPTTLLSQVDASVGGKSGVDYSGYKNLVGSFFPAEMIIIDSEMLISLPDDQFLSGMGEVVKHAFLSPDNRLFDFLRSNSDKIMQRDADVLKEMVKLSLEVKKHYIELDPEEKRGIRSFLNLGHTFSHALETITDYQVSHGLGVAWGVKMALDAGVLTCITEKDYRDKAVELLSMFPFRLDYDFGDKLDDYLDAIGKDKKKKNGTVKFVLMEGQGRPVLSELDSTSILKVVSQSFNL